MHHEVQAETPSNPSGIGYGLPATKPPPHDKTRNFGSGPTERGESYLKCSKAADSMRTRRRGRGYIALG